MTALMPHVAAAERLRQLPRTLESYAGFAEVLAELAAGRPASLDGIWGSSCALVAAALSQHAAGPLVVVCPNQREADDLAADLELFTTALPTLYPAWDLAESDRLIHDETFGERLRVVKGLMSEVRDQRSEVRGQKAGVRSQEAGTILVTSIQALLQPSPAKADIDAGTRVLRRGERIDVPELLKWLVERGFEHTTAVQLPGEFSHRGGILDIFAPDWLRPVRIELFDEEVDSLRSFDVVNQRSHETLEEIDVTVVGGEESANAKASGGREPPGNAERAAQRDREADASRSLGHFTDYLPPSAWLLLFDPDRIASEGQSYLGRVDNASVFHSVPDVLAECSKFTVATTAEIQSGTAGVHCHLPIESVERFSGDMNRIREELDDIAGQDEVFIITTTEAEIERLREILATTRLAAAGRLQYPIGTLRQGFRLRPSPLPHPSPLPEGEGTGNRSNAGLLLLTGSELFHRGELRRLPRRRLGKAIDSFLDLRPGDLVVHLAHGIGRYRGLKLLEKNNQSEEHLEIEFDGGTKIYVPAVKIDLVQKYVGGAKTRPTLAKIGGKSWLKQKQAASDAVRDLAVEMLDMQAMRMSRPGIKFNPDSEWQREFDHSFPYRETPDQLTAIDAIKKDMHSPRPMDRLLCGDVGFGKTEVAMRAAFKAVDSGYQVAVLVPTTILAEQHFHSFGERMAEFPFDIAKLSRFCTAEEERAALAGVKSGKVDVVIGTHRVASKDVQFHNLGLVIIDEEQRFGVDVKERLKAFRTTVDVLTLSATPIPRTLHMSLVGVRDISNLESPPEDRLAVETKVARWDDELIRHGILRELARGGQIFFVHNRVQDIELIANRLRMLVPEVKLRIGHAQMADNELEQVMVDFVSGKFDLLLSTTIVESGLDIPNANTIFIDESDRYGLADLHQLRGRVGRYKNRAHCYLLIEPHKHLTPNAARRLRAIEEFSEMGAGFAIAMRDLEIRGAGNLLGTQQSGHIAAVGYELYCQLLENAVRTLQRMPPKITLDVDIQLPGEAFLPDEYVSDLRLKIDLYRRLSRVSQFAELDDFRTELVDRFGEPPPQANHLLALAALKMDAALWQISAIFLENQFVVLRYGNAPRIEKLAKLRRGQVRVVDDKSAYVPIPSGVTSPDRLFAMIKSVLRQPD